MVSSYLQLLENKYGEELDPEAQEYIDYSVDGADRTRAMVESLLNYSQVKRQGQPLEPTNTEEILEDVLLDLEPRIEETSATVTVDDLPTVSADADQLAQVFRNLISNALAYSGDVPPEVHIGAEQVGGEWQFVVADEGVGIDPEHHERIFKSFERLNIQEEVSGTGIGLALCKRIIERHSGEMWVESEPGEGARFYFTLPTARGETEFGLPGEREQIVG